MPIVVCCRDASCLTDWETCVVLSKGGQCLLVQRGQLLRLSNEWRHSAFQSRGVSPLVPGEWTPCRVFHLESGLLEFRRTLTKHTGARKTEQANTDRVFLSGMGWFVFYALLIKSYRAWKILGCLFCFIIMCPWRCNCKPPGSDSYHRS